MIKVSQEKWNELQNYKQKNSIERITKYAKNQHSRGIHDLPFVSFNKWKQ